MERSGIVIFPAEEENYIVMGKECFGFGLGKIMIENHFCEEPWELADLLLLAFVRGQCKNCNLLGHCYDFIFNMMQD